MRILLSGGGTAGHIYPALTVADRFREDGHEVHFVGTAIGPEARLVSEAGLMFHAVPARGFDRSRPLSLVGSISILAASALRAYALLGRVRPAVVVGFGGYVSIPVGIAAAARRIPLVLHEQNSVPGLANRFLARWACAVGVTYPDSADALRRSRIVETTGNPVRPAVLAADRATARAGLGVADDELLVLAFGGSRGARHLNEALVRARPHVLARNGVRVLHVAGPSEVADVRSQVEAVSGDDELSSRYRIADYLDDMGSALAASDVVVARAGATSIAEITALGRAAVLVPYPYATDDHQTLNARDVSRAGGATVVADAGLDDETFVEALVALIDDPAIRESMAAASRALGRPDATDRLAALAYGCAAGTTEVTA